MGPLRSAYWSAIAAAVFAPSAAFAASSLSLKITGEASPGFSGRVVDLRSGARTDTSFAGQPVTILLDIQNLDATPYVSHFAVGWSDQPQTLPYITGWSGGGELETPTNSLDVTFFSNVSLSDTGGTIQIRPSSGFIGVTDAEFNLNLTFATTGTHPLGSRFTDTATGSGSARGFLTFVVDPVIGPYDAGSTGGFTVESVTADLPEPATWAMLIGGFGAIGVMLRRRRTMRLGLAAYSQ